MQQASSRQPTFPADKTHSLSSSVSSNASLNDGRSSVPYQQPPPQHQGAGYPSRIYTTIYTNDTNLPSTKGVTDIRLHTNLAPDYNGHHFVDPYQRSARMHVNTGRQPQSGYQSTNHGGVGMSTERTRPANCLHVGKDGELTQTYVSKSMDPTRHVSGYPMNRLPGAADGTYITYNSEFYPKL